MTDADLIMKAMDDGRAITVTTKADGSRTIRIAAASRNVTEPMTPAERARRYRQGKKESQAVTASVTLEPETVTNVTKRHADTLPPPLSPPTPSPLAPTHGLPPDAPVREGFPAPCTEAQAIQAAQMSGTPAECVPAWWADCDGRGWVDRHGLRIVNWRSSLKAFGVRWQSNDKQREHEQAERLKRIGPPRTAPAGARKEKARDFFGS